MKNPYIRTFLLTIGLSATTLFTLFVSPVLVGAQVQGANLSPSTTSAGYIYLSQVPYTGFGDFLKLLGFLIIIGLWSLLVVMVLKSDKVKAIMARMFRNVDEEERLSAAGLRAGYVFDVSNNQVLNMNMNPVHEIPEHYVHSHPDLKNNHDNGNHSSEALPRDERAYTLNESNGDTISDVNAFINLLVRGEANAVFEHLRKMKAKGVEAADFATNVVLELDSAYRAKLDGENNKRNIVLSQIISHWNRSKIEAVISSLLAIVDQSYADPNVGTKVAIMRIMRAV